MAYRLAENLAQHFPGKCSGILRVYTIKLISNHIFITPIIGSKMKVHRLVYVRQNLLPAQRMHRSVAGGHIRITRAANANGLFRTVLQYHLSDITGTPGKKIF